jgi:hypothetical protein
VTVDTRTSIVVEAVVVASVPAVVVSVLVVPVPSDHRRYYRTSLQIRRR